MEFSISPPEIQHAEHIVGTSNLQKTYAHKQLEKTT